MCFNYLGTIKEYKVFFAAQQVHVGGISTHTSQKPHEPALSSLQHLYLAGRIRPKAEAWESSGWIAHSTKTTST